MSYQKEEGRGWEEQNDFKRAVLSSVKLSVGHLKKQTGTHGENEPRDFPLEERKVVVKGDKPTLDLRSDSMTVVNRGRLVHRIAGKTQTHDAKKPRGNCGSGGRRDFFHTASETGEFAKHVYREHHKMADTWAKKEGDRRAKMSVNKREWDVTGATSIRVY